MADGRPAAMRAVAAAAAMADQRVAAESGADTGSDEATEAASRGVRSGPDEGVHQPPADERAEPALRDAQRPLDGVRASSAIYLTPTVRPTSTSTRSSSAAQAPE